MKSLVSFFLFFFIVSVKLQAQMRVIVKESTAINIEMPKPGNVNTNKTKVFYSLIDLYFENSVVKSPQKMNVFFEGQSIITTQVTSNETLSYVADRDPNTDKFLSAVIFEPLPAKYTFTIYSETVTQDIKNKIRVFVDNKPVSVVFKFAVVPAVETSKVNIEPLNKPKLKNKKNG
jgi:hypothetical protein